MYVTSFILYLHDWTIATMQFLNMQDTDETYRLLFRKENILLYLFIYFYLSRYISVKIRKLDYSERLSYPENCHCGHHL